MEGLSMDFKYYDVDELDINMNYRWVQPPQIAYFVTTIDEFGNPNVTPVTLGTCIGANLPRNGKLSEYYFSFSLGSKTINDEGSKLNLRHGFLNIEKKKECVISYITQELLEKSWIASLPIPRGISEIEVANLNQLPSKKVAPPGIKECPVNMEAKVINKLKLGSYYMHYICKVVGVSVNKEFIDSDNKMERKIGILAADPIYEVIIDRGDTGNSRLYYGKIDRNFLARTSDNIGCKEDWIGDFDKWIWSEMERGKIDKSEYEEIIKLKKVWAANRDPQKNQQVKKELTEKLKALVWS